MKMFKRGLSLLLAVVMVLSLFTVAVSADTGSDSTKKPTFTVATPKGTGYKAGASFEAAVVLKNPVPFTSLQALIDFDHDALTLDEIMVGPDEYTFYVPGASETHNTKWTTEDKETAKDVPEGVKDGVEYGFINYSRATSITSLNPTYNGVIFKLKFTVKENVTKDSANIKFITWIFQNAVSGVTTDLESESVAGTVNLVKSTPQTHAITVTNDGNGTASASPVSATAGTEITLTAEANEGYEFKSWTTESTDITLKDTSKADSSEHTATFTMPDHAVTVKANFQKRNFAITVDSAIKNGKLEAPATAQMGDTVTLTPIPDTGYKTESVTADGAVQVTLADGKYTFTMPARNVKVSATFVKQTFTVTKSTGLSGNPTATYGEDYIGTIAPYQPGSGYTYAVKYTVGSSTEQKTATISSTGTFTIPGADVTGDLNITLTTNQKTVTVTFKYEHGGTDTRTILYGMDVTPLPTCNEEGYEYAFTTADGKPWTGRNITADVTVTVTKVAKQYNVTLSDGLTGSAEKATYKTAYTVTITGYDTSAYAYELYYKVGDSAETKIVPENGTVTIPAAAVTGTLNVRLVKTAKYTVTFKDKDSNTIGTPEVVLDGAKVTTVPAAPAVAKFAFDKWRDGTSLFTTDEVKARVVTGNVTYTATYTQAEFNVTNNAGESLNAPDSAARNTPCTVTINGYAEGTYTYKLTYKVGDGEARTISNNGNTFTIPGPEITGNITLLSVTGTAVVHDVELGTGLSGDPTATYGENYTGTIADYNAAKYSYTVNYTVGGGETQTATVYDNGNFVIVGSEIKGKLRITRTQTLRKFTVTYTDDYTGTAEVEYGGNAILPTAPTGYDYSFKVGNQPWDGKNITADVTVTVTKTARQYNVTLGEGLSSTTAKATHGADYVVTIAPYEPARYTYAVKYRVNGGAEQNATAYSANSFVIFGKDVTGDLTLRLVKKGIPYSVTVNVGAVQGTASASPASAEAGTTVTLTATPKPGYAFKAWQSRDVAITDAGQFTMPAKNVTVTAVFERVYTVTFQTNGGSYVAPQTLKANETVTKPAADPSRTGYTFTGWYADSACTTAYTFGRTVSADTTIYAGWRAHTYTIVFDKNDRDATGTMSRQRFTYDEAQRLSSCNFELKDHVFSGWALTANGRAVYADRESVRNLTNVDGAVLTLYAVWTDELPWLLPSDDDWSDASRRFDDVLRNAWYRDAVDFVVGNDLMNGVSYNLFAPNDTMTRAMVVTVLYRLEGEPHVYGGARFTDAVRGSWYADAVAWASENGIVKGTSDTTFSPKQDVTREQLAAILYRYSEYCGYRTSGGMSIAGFSDAGEVSAYARDAVKWAYGIGLIEGRTATTLAPKGTATRAEVATILMRYCKYVMR